MSPTRKCLTALLFGASLIGCSGDNIVVPSRFTGMYDGTWKNIADAQDQGSSVWSVDSSGNISGEDYDPRNNITYHVVGKIDEAGRVTTVSTPDNGQPASSLNGAMTSENGWFTGQLVWGVEPPLTYNYTFTRRLYGN
jgi:hypothetical protein